MTPLIHLPAPCAPLECLASASATAASASNHPNATADLAPEEHDQTNGGRDTNDYVQQRQKFSEDIVAYSVLDVITVEAKGTENQASIVLS